MANEDTMFSFQMMNAMSSAWPADVQTNEMYRCSQTTLLQLQEKVLRSLSKKYEDENLQVVPQNNKVFEDDSSSPNPFRESCAVKCRENRAKKEFIENHSVSTASRERPEKAESQQSLPRSPNLRKTPFLAVASCTSTEPLLTPTFPHSPLLKSPANCKTAPVSPLAMMILSPFGRKPSEDLSMYLPENFTPAATLERLESSISSTVFEFPSVEENLNDSKEMNSKREQHNEGSDVEDNDICSTESNIHVTAHEVFVDLNDSNCFEVKSERDYDLALQSPSPQNEGIRKTRRKGENAANSGDLLRFRNKLERKRRSEMNCKYDKLQRCIPEIEKRQKVAKIAILRSAIEYIQELHTQDKLLTKQKNLEKLRNEELLRKLVRINTIR